MTDNCLHFNLSLWCVESLAASSLRQKTLNTVRAERFRVCWDYNSQRAARCAQARSGAGRRGAAGSGRRRELGRCRPAGECGAPRRDPAGAAPGGRAGGRGARGASSRAAGSPAAAPLPGEGGGGAGGVPPGAPAPAEPAPAALRSVQPGGAAAGSGGEGPRPEGAALRRPRP